MDTSKLIVKPREWTRELIHHDMKAAREQLGPLYEFLSDEMVEGADVTVFVHYVKGVPAQPPSYVHPHSHDSSQIYVFPEKGLTFEASLGEEKHVVESPATVFIPAGLKHSLRMLKGSGIEVCITRRARYG